MITAVEKTSDFSTTGGTSKATASVVPTANRGYIFWMNSASAGVATAPSGVTGMGMSWTKILEVVSPNGSQNLTAWASKSATPTTGALTATWAVATETVAWKLDEFDGIDITGSATAFIRAAQNGQFSGTAQVPSFNLASSIGNDNAVVSAIAYNAGSTQFITAAGTGYSLLGAVEVPTGSPTGQLAVEFNQDPINNTVTWTTTNTNNKSIIALELIVAPVAPSTSVTIVERISNSTTTPTTATNTASVAPVANRGYLLWVATSHATAAVSPTGVTGMGMTWVKHLEILSSNGLLHLSAWRAQNWGGAATTGALTIAYAAAPNSVAWKLDQLEGASPSGTSGSGMFRTANNYTQAVATSNPTGELPNQPNVNDGVISAVAYNAGSVQTLTAGASGNFTLLGTPIQVATSTPMQLAVEYDVDGGDRTVDWTSTSGSSKAIIGLEVVANAQTPVANAGGDQTVDAFDLVSLIGSGSSGTPPYAPVWTGPGGVTIINPNTLSASFRAPPSLTQTTLTFTLTLTDAATIVGTDTVDITVRAHNAWTRRAGVLVGRWLRTRRSGVLVG